MNHQGQTVIYCETQVENNSRDQLSVIIRSRSLRDCGRGASGRGGGAGAKAREAGAKAVPESCRRSAHEFPGAFGIGARACSRLLGAIVWRVDVLGCFA